MGVGVSVCVSLYTCEYCVCRCTCGGCVYKETENLLENYVFRRIFIKELNFYCVRTTSRLSAFKFDRSMPTECGH